MVNSWLIKNSRDDGRLHGPAALAALAVTSIATSLYSADRQRKSVKEASNKQRDAEFEARRIASEKKPIEEAATLGVDTGANDDLLGSLGLIVKPEEISRKKNLGLGSTAGSTAGLGFGTQA